MKVTQRVNFRVVVEPATPRYWKESAATIEATCGRIAQEIRRHVDDVDHTMVKWDVQENCSHCGHEWTEESSVYNGGCCDKDHAPAAAIDALSEFFAMMADEQLEVKS